jgi:TolB-like protein
LTIFPGRPSPDTRTATAIAVLKFRDESPDQGGRYIGIGLAETLSKALDQTGVVRVASRDSTLEFDRPGADPGETARRLHVDALIDGTLCVEGGRVRLTCRLRRAEDGRSLWSQDFDRPLDDVDGVKAEIVEKIVEKVGRRD